MIKKLDIDGLKKKADFIRENVVTVSVKNGAGHIAPSLSCIDILTALYYSVMDLSNDPQWEGRDRLVFSKGHGCYGLYAIMADIGYISKKEWNSFYKESSLCGCIERNTAQGIEASCGSLGHGLPQAVGLAFGAKLQNRNFMVFCIVGDGEMQEGSNWEAVQFAVKHRLDNLIVIIDANKLQAMDFLKNILTLEEREDSDLKIKMAAFGFVVKECPGHDLEKIVTVLAESKNRQEKGGKPQVLIANTIKGYGLLCMENVPKFHFRIPTEEELTLGKRYA